MGVSSAAAAGASAQPLRSTTGWRFAALVTDMLVLAALGLAFASTYGVQQVTSGRVLLPGEYGGGGFTSSYLVAWPWDAIGWLGYYAAFELLFGATPGKLLFGVRITDEHGGPASAVAVIKRTLLRPVDMIFLVGGFRVLFSDNGQRFGDVWARTLVLPAERGTNYSPLRLAKGRLAIISGSLLLVVLAASFAFSYFARPSLDIEGWKNTAQLAIAPKVNPSSVIRLGQPQWGWGTVTYPISFMGYLSPHGQLTGPLNCEARLVLKWRPSFPFGSWEQAGASGSCGATRFQTAGS